MKKVKNFFWWCSGSDSNLLNTCPTDSSKYFGIGGTVIFTGIFASFSIGYALYTIFDNLQISILLALFWGFMIFNLDRYIVSGIRKKDRFSSDFLMILPRIILAGLIAITISKPLELKIFEREIDSELIIIGQEKLIEMDSIIKSRHNKLITDINDENMSIQKNIQLKQSERNHLRLEAQMEADGTGGSKQRNLGPIYKIKKKNELIVQDELDSLKREAQLILAINKLNLDSVNKIIATDILSLQNSTNYTGLAARMEALDRLTQKSNAIFWANIFILLLFLAIETAPVFVKLISEKGPYDNLLFRAEHEIEIDNLLKVADKKNSALEMSNGLNSEIQEWLKMRVLKN